MYVGFIQTAYLLVYSTTIFLHVYFANKATPSKIGGKFHLALVERTLAYDIARIWFRPGQLTIRIFINYSSEIETPLTPKPNWGARQINFGPCHPFVFIGWLMTCHAYDRVARDKLLIRPVCRI